MNYASLYYQEELGIFYMVLLEQIIIPKCIYMYYCYAQTVR